MTHAGGSLSPRAGSPTLRLGAQSADVRLRRASASPSVSRPAVVDLLLLGAPARLTAERDDLQTMLEQQDPMLQHVDLSNVSDQELAFTVLALCAEQNSVAFRARPDFGPGSVGMSDHIEIEVDLAFGDHTRTMFLSVPGDIRDLLPVEADPVDTEHCAEEIEVCPEEIGAGPEEAAAHPGHVAVEWCRYAASHEEIAGLRPGDIVLPPDLDPPRARMFFGSGSWRSCRFEDDAFVLEDELESTDEGSGGASGTSLSCVSLAPLHALVVERPRAGSRVDVALALIDRVGLVYGDRLIGAGKLVRHQGSPAIRVEAMEQEVSS